MKVALCTPSLDGKVQDEYSLSMSQTLIACAKAGIDLWPCGARGITVVHDARNHLVARAMREGADKVFFIDPDYFAFATLRNFASWDLAKDGDSNRKQILVEYTSEVRNEKAHAAVYDLTTS